MCECITWAFLFNLLLLNYYYEPRKGSWLEGTLPMAWRQNDWIDNFSKYIKVTACVLYKLIHLFCMHSSITYYLHFQAYILMPLRAIFKTNFIYFSSSSSSSFLFLPINLFFLLLPFNFVSFYLFLSYLLVPFCSFTSSYPSPPSFFAFTVYFNY